jgi:hypothetical protein
MDGQRPADWEPVLIFDAERSSVEAAVASLPLMHAGLIDAELIELHPSAGY